MKIFNKNNLFNNNKRKKLFSICNKYVCTNTGYTLLGIVKNTGDNDW